MVMKKSQTISNTRSFVSASVAWYNINVYSESDNSCFKSGVARESVQIIKNVSGQVSAGTTLAIMGSSGAGKTTLLNVLTARNLSNFRVDGYVKINGRMADVDMITSMSAYVQQQDIFIPTLTVREHLVFQAMVRMDKSIKDDQKLARINDVLKELSLNKCAETMVGGTVATGKGISGGELKRLAFAVEILTNPSIMFCDEPTSGLDSFMAANLVMYLNKMAAAGRTIICTIHQPSSEVFALFKSLLLMADGRVAYMGDRQGALTHFERLGFRCPLNYNPADFYVHELAIMPGKEEACKKKIGRICDLFEKEQTHIEDHRQPTSFVAKENVSRYKVPCLLQYQALAWRAALVTIREPLLTYVRLLQAVSVSTIIGFFYLHQQYDQRGMMNINGALFLFLVNLTIQNAFAVVNTFCSELPIFLREHNSGMYRVDAYFITKNLAETPVFVAIPICVGCINYYMIGYNPAFDAFLYYITVGMGISMIGVSYGYFISCICNDTDLALSVGPPILIPLQLLGGFFLNTKTIPSWLSWAQYISWFHYGFDLLIRNQWEHVRYLDCPAISSNSTTSPTPTPTPHKLGFPVNTPSSTEIVLGQYVQSGTCFKDGKQVIEFLDLGQSSEGFNFALICVLIFIMRAISYLALYIRAIRSR